MTQKLVKIQITQVFERDRISTKPKYLYDVTKTFI